MPSQLKDYSTVFTVTPMPILLLMLPVRRTTMIVGKKNRSSLGPHMTRLTLG